MTGGLERLSLRYNPFEPAASGLPLGIEPWIPATWARHITDLLDRIGTGHGAKAMAILGEYGSGKTYVLQWLAHNVLPQRRIRPYYLDNPGVQFYDLANSLLKQIGRYEFAKMLWEYVSPKLPGYQPSLYDDGDLLSWLESVKKWKMVEPAKAQMALGLREKGITQDEEISYRLASIVLGTLDQPYFEYRDFVAGHKDSVVAEGEQAPYFKALIRVLLKAGDSRAIALLLDEFEEISLQKRLSQKQAYDYLATMKRLLNVAGDEDFWLIVSMTPEAKTKIQQLDPSLWDRFSTQGAYIFEIPRLTTEEARELVQGRLKAARPTDGPTLPLCYPFPEEFAELLRPTTVSLPRRLVKVAFYAIAEASVQDHEPLPLSASFIQAVEAKVYPAPPNHVVGAA